MTSVREVYRSRDKLGEVPVWDVAEQALYWVDIEGKRLRRLDQATGTVRTWNFPERIGSFALRKRGGLVCAFESGLAFYDLETQAIDWIAKPDRHIARNRFNDGKCDRMGRFWAGTMDDRLTDHCAALYRLDPDLTVAQVEQNVCISNSLAWSPDNTTFYFADTPDNAIYAYDYDHPTGTISNRRLFSSTNDRPALQMDRRSTRRAISGMRSGTVGVLCAMRRMGQSIVSSTCRCNARPVACSAAAIWGRSMSLLRSGTLHPSNWTDSLGLDRCWLSMSAYAACRSHALPGDCAPRLGGILRCGSACGSAPLKTTGSRSGLFQSHYDQYGTAPQLAFGVQKGRLFTSIWKVQKSGLRGREFESIAFLAAVDGIFS
jgi:hypothetical protein